MENETIEKIKNIKNIPIGWAFLIVIIIVVVFSFYWFSVRPEQIRKECYKNRNMYGIYYHDYEGCLKGNGLE